MINQNLTSLTSPSGNRVVLGKAIELRDGATFMFSQNDAHGRMGRVQIIEANNIKPPDIFLLLNSYYEYMASRLNVYREYTVLKFNEYRDYIISWFNTL